MSFSRFNIDKELIVQTANIPPGSEDESVETVPSLLGDILAA